VFIYGYNTGVEQMGDYIRGKPMQLYFVRHGRAEDRAMWNPNQDHLRPLTEDGIDRMRKSAHTFQQLKVSPTVIYSSPMTRAKQTADIMAGTLKCDVVLDDRLVNFGVSALTELVRKHQQVESLMFVGHEPDFSTVVEMITGGGHVMVKKGSLIRIDLFALRPPRGTLIWNIPPRMLVMP
jgi:phosphohistidine phosphatase